MALHVTFKVIFLPWELFIDMVCFMYASKYLLYFTNLTCKSMFDFKTDFKTQKQHQNWISGPMKL